MTESIENSPVVGLKAWSTPTIEDYGIVGTTRDIDLVPGIDAFEASNPAGYGS